MSVQHAVKHALVALARPRHYEVVRRTQRGFDRRAFAEHVRRQLRRLEIGCVLDVGANRGQYRDFLRDSVGYTGRIVSFEPIPELAASLRERAAAEDPKWEVLPYALGAAEEQRDLHVMRGRSYSSFCQPGDVAVKARIVTKNVVERMEPVLIRRLDDVVADGLRLGPGGIWLKVDTQGWDLEVLRGAARTLPSVSGLQIELSVIPIYQGIPDYLTVLRQLREFGFEIGALTPVNRDRLGRVIEFDCALVASAERPQAHSAVEEHHDPPLERLRERPKRQRASEPSCIDASAAGADPPPVIDVVTPLAGLGAAAGPACPLQPRAPRSAGPDLAAGSAPFPPAPRESAMSSDDLQVFRAFQATIDQLQAMHAVVLLRPREISPEAAFDGDYDFLFDPDRFADIVAAAVVQCRRHGASLTIEQHAPYKRRICFICEDPERRIQIELWPHAELTVPNGRSRLLAAIPWRSARPFLVESGPYLALQPAAAAAIYLTHLHHKQKSLGSPEVRRRLAYYEDLLFRSAGEVAAELLGAIRALRSGSTDLEAANVRACSALSRMGIRVRILRIAPLLQRVRRHLTQAVAGRNGMALAPVPVLGPDGSGKTAIISALAELERIGTLRFKDVFRTSLFYRGFLRVRGRSAARRRRARNLMDESLAQAILIIALVRWAPLIISRLARRCLRGRSEILVDRYFWDYLARIRDTDARPSRISGYTLFSRLVPKPHRVVVLCCGLETLYSRKQELSAPAVDYIYELYCDQIARKRVKHVLMLSTEGPFDRSYRQVAWFLLPDAARHSKASSGGDRGRVEGMGRTARWANRPRASLEESGPEAALRRKRA